MGMPLDELLKLIPTPPLQRLYFPEYSEHSVHCPVNYKVFLLWLVERQSIHALQGLQVFWMVLSSASGSFPPILLCSVA